MRTSLVWLTLVMAVPPAHAEVKVWQGTLTLPTYEEGPADPQSAIRCVFDGQV